MHPSFDAALFQILEDAPNAYLVMVSEKVEVLTYSLWKRLSISLRPYLNRIRFISFANYNTLILYSTVVLDTYPYGGMYTMYLLNHCD